MIATAAFREEKAVNLFSAAERSVCTVRREASQSIFLIKLEIFWGEKCYLI